MRGGRFEVRGSRVRERGPRKEGKLGGNKGNRGGELVTGWEGREKGEVREGASGLPDVGSAGTGGDGMICPPAVRTATPLSPATAFLGGKSTLGTSGTVQIHGGETGGAGGRGTRGGVCQREEFGNERRTWLRGGLRSEQCGGRLILLHHNSRREVSLKSGGERTPGCEFKPNIFFKLI